MKSLTLFSIALVAFSCATKTDKKTEDSQMTQEVTKQDFIGAWKASYENETGDVVELVTIVTDGYISEAIHNVAAKRFDATYGGTWRLDGGRFAFTFEFSTQDTALVGTTRMLEFSMNGKTLKFPGEDYEWTKIDDGAPGALEGAWLITGRKRDGEISRRVPGARKTMKILSGTRFQWIAYNVDTKEFFGTGGGSYTTVDGTYIENIEFFSRDSSRVGASLEFQYSLDSGEWHHSGLNSRGEPLYEIWTPRSMLE